MKREVIFWKGIQLEEKETFSVLLKIPGFVYCLSVARFGKIYISSVTDSRWASVAPREEVLLQAYAHTHDLHRAPAPALCLRVYVSAHMRMGNLTHLS